MSWGSSVSLVTGLRSGRTGFDFKQKQGFIVLATASKRARGPNQTPTHWVPEVSLSGEWA